MQWTADDNIGDAKLESSAVQGSLPDVDLFAWWCNSGGGSTAGIAYVGTVCNQNGFATSLNEYQGTIAAAAYVSFCFVAKGLFDSLKSLLRALNFSSYE